MSKRRTLKANGVEPEFLMVSVCSTSTVKGPGDMLATASKARASNQVSIRLKLSSRGSISTDMMGGRRIRGDLNRQY